VGCSPMTESGSTRLLRNVPPADAKYRKDHPANYAEAWEPPRILAGESVAFNLDVRDDDLYCSGDRTVVYSSTSVAAARGEWHAVR
jgi:hypothetical protein